MPSHYAMATTKYIKLIERTMDGTLKEELFPTYGPIREPERFFSKPDLGGIPENMFKESLQTINSVNEFEKEYPQLAKDFQQLQKEQYELFAKKMLSYGLHNISVGSNLETEEERYLALTGVWFRMNDKIQRLKQLIVLRNANPLENEPVEDAYKDISTYGLICLLVKSSKWKK